MPFIRHLVLVLAHCEDISSDEKLATASRLIAGKLQHVLRSELSLVTLRPREPE